MAKDLRIDTGSRPRQLPPEAHIRMHFEKFSSFVEEYSSKLSLSGMFVATRDPRPVGSEVAFDLKLVDGFRLVHGHGEVAWVRLQDGGPGRPAGMALRFVALDEKGRGLVLKVLEEQLKAGGLPFEIDPPPMDAILDYSGPPSPRQIALPLQPAHDEEPTLITSRRRSLDETGFDAPWGQKLPEVPTDLLDDSAAGPSVPKVSEVSFAPEAAPARPAPATAGGAGASSSLFAAAFPGQSSRSDSPVDLGFVLDEAPLQSPAPAVDLGWNAPDPFAPGALAGTEDPEIDFGQSPGDIPFDPDPADLAMPSFDSEEPTLLGKAPVFFGEEEPTVVGSRQSVLPAVGMFEVGPPASAFPAASGPAFEAAPAPPAFGAFEAPAFEAPAFDAPAFEAPAFEAPAFGAAAPFEPPVYEAPAPAFAAPAWDANDFGSPAAVSSPSAAPAYPGPALGDELWDARRAAGPAEPFADARPSASPGLGADPLDLGAPGLFGPPASAPAPPMAAAYGAPGPPTYSPGYFDGSGVASPPDGDPFDPNEDWSEEPEPSRGARLKAALTSRKAIIGLALTAVLVTGAYFLAGDLLGGKEEMPLAAGPPANRPQAPAARPDPAAAPAGTEGENPLPMDAASGPEQVVATNPDEEVPAVAMPSRTESAADSRGPAEVDIEPSRTEPARTEPARTEPARRSTASARHMLRAEARKTADSTIVDLIFDGDVDPGSVAHDSFTWTADREKITFKGLDRPRQDVLRVGSPQLKAVRFSWSNEGQTAVFDVPVGASIASVTPEGNQVRVVLVR